MCGIGGIIQTNGVPVDESALAILGDEIQHRGPDGTGVVRCSGSAHHVAFVHRRLAILDTTPAANQPMGSDDLKVWLTYNGEIYNYRDLRERLVGLGYRFRSTGDSEVLLHAYEQWGIDCLTRLNGMFAFAIWDGRRQELLLARDRLGIKPLYYSWDGSTLVFCSEIRGLAAILGDNLTEDPTALAFFATLGYIPAPFSIYREIRKLEPGHWMRLRGLALSTCRYWDVDFTHKERRPLSQLVPEIASRLGEAVSRQMVSDVPVGAFLSGGVDSGGVVALMARSTIETVNTFTIGFAERDYDETSLARLVAARYRTAHREFEVAPQSMDVIPTIVRHFGEPFGDSSALPTYHLAALTRQHVTVALSGDGGDELFCGYTINLGHQLSQLYRVLPGPVRHGILRAIGKLRLSDVGRVNRAVLGLRKRLEDAELDPVSRVYSKNVAFPKTLGEMITRTIDYAPVEQLFRDLLLHGNASSFLDRIAYLELKLSLPDDMLAKVDRMSMAHSLEVRVPYLDHEFVEYVATVPVEHRFRHWRTKWLLRKVLEPHLPRKILKGKKRGFNAPLWNWFPARRAGVASHARDVRDDKGWWGKMILEEWRRQDQEFRLGLVQCRTRSVAGSDRSR